VLEPVPVSQSPEDKFREYLTSRSRPQRFTLPQRAMVRYIFSAHNHFDAETLGDNMKTAGIHVSRATMYRTLSKLVDAGMLRRLELGARIVYEHDYGYPYHEHLHCQKCGQVIEFQSPEMEQLLQEICRQHQFQAQRLTLAIHGVCQNCNYPRVRRRLDLV
jgi:Fur family transcriptional regulator, ferric uptake regulator